MIWLFIDHCILGLSKEISCTLYSPRISYYYLEGDTDTHNDTQQKLQKNLYPLHIPLSNIMYFGYYVDHNMVVLLCI